MILIVGGRGQGQTEYAKQCLNDLSESKEDGFRIADGNSDEPKMAIGADLILNLHAFVRSVMKVGGDPRVFTRELLESAPEIVTIDEVGCGIVPIDAFEREYRDRGGSRRSALCFACRSGISHDLRNPAEDSITFKRNPK